MARALTQVQAFLPEGHRVREPFTKRAAGPAFCSGLTQPSSTVLFSFLSVSIKA